MTVNYERDGQRSENHSRPRSEKRPRPEPFIKPDLSKHIDSARCCNNSRVGK